MQVEVAMSAAEVAARFGVPERLVLHWARTGRITTYHQGYGRRVFLPSEVGHLVRRLVPAGNDNR